MGEAELAVSELLESNNWPNPESDVEEVTVEEEEEHPEEAAGGAERPVLSGGGEEEESSGAVSFARGRLARRLEGGEDRDTAQKNGGDRDIRSWSVVDGSCWMSIAA